MRATIYLRVSTDEQGASGAGLDAQKAACVAYAESKDAEVTSIHTDMGVSGAAPLGERPALLEAISFLDDGDILLVGKRDRLARDPIVAAMIEAAVERRGAKVISAAGEGTEGDGPTSILMRRIVDAFAEYERLIIKARTKAALRAKQVKGERTGGVPYGCSVAADGKLLVPIPREMEVIRLARSLRAQGKSLRAISTRLTELGRCSRSGRPFAASQIKRMVERSENVLAA